MAIPPNQNAEASHMPAEIAPVKTGEDVDHNASLDE